MVSVYSVKTSSANFTLDKTCPVVDIYSVVTVRTRGKAFSLKGTERDISYQVTFIPRPLQQNIVNSKFYILAHKFLPLRTTSSGFSCLVTLQFPQEE